MMRIAVVASMLVGLLVAPAPGHASDCTKTSVGFTPLNDLGTGTYLGNQGGLYPGGANDRPASHTAQGEALARLVTPRNLAGVPDATAGKIVFLSIGMSNTRNEFTRFVPIAQADPLRHPRVQAINGAIGGQTAADISNPAAPYWAMVDQMLAQSSASPAQVGAVWLKEANRQPSGDPIAHARQLQADLQAIAQNLRLHFPNLGLVYLASRIYAGYASTTLNPEPYAYASGFSVKWLIESQIDGTFATQNPTRGVIAPWLSWGPYLWADGLTARSDGLTWACSDFNNDGTHPNATGSVKVANMILDFVHTDSTARIWYQYAGSPPA